MKEPLVELYVVEKNPADAGFWVVEGVDEHTHSVINALTPAVLGGLPSERAGDLLVDLHSGELGQAEAKVLYGVLQQLPDVITRRRQDVLAMAVAGLLSSTQVNDELAACASAFEVMWLNPDGYELVGPGEPISTEVLDEIFGKDIPPGYVHALFQAIKAGTTEVASKYSPSYHDGDRQSRPRLQSHEPNLVLGSKTDGLFVPKFSVNYGPQPDSISLAEIKPAAV